MLCVKCSNIHYRRLEQCDLIKQEPERLLIDDPEYTISDWVFYIHHRSEQALYESSENGCHFCAMIYDRLFGEYGSFHETRPFAFSRGEIILARRCSGDPLDSFEFERWNRFEVERLLCIDRLIYFTRHGNYSGLFGDMLHALTECKDRTSTDCDDTILRGRSSVKESKLEATGSMMCSTENLHPKHNPNLYSPWIDTSTTSQASMELARFWMQTCMQKHASCRASQREGPLPTRILDISKPESLILREGLDLIQPYITLSYKWGKSRRYTTALENLQMHMTLGIPLEKLPQTFKDAIFVARELGFRWLWIDALCICQDLQSEKIQEIERMNVTFRHSTLTIFASAGDNADAGLTRSRDPRWVKPCRVTIKTTLAGMTMEKEVHISLPDDRTSAPLYRRGWVLQEEILSNRGLLFESRQLQWRCFCGVADETTPSRWNGAAPDSLQKPGVDTPVDVRYQMMDYDRFDHFRRCISHKNPHAPRYNQRFEINHYDAWYEMVQDYSTRALTYNEDVFPAIAGLAKAVAEMHGCNYHDGLWEQDFHRGLCWFLERQLTGCSYSTVDHAVMLPSWTWACQWGRPIRFRKWKEGQIEAFKEDVSCLGISICSIPEVRDSSISTGIQKLELSGKLIKVVVGERWDIEQYMDEVLEWSWGDELYGQWLWVIRHAKTNEKMGEVAFDFDPEGHDLSHIYCLLCIVREKKQKGKEIAWDLGCLALVPVDDMSQEFRRVGFIVIRSEKWFEGPSFSGAANEGSRGAATQGDWETGLHRTIRLV